MTDASINFDLLARDRASDKFQKVGKAADQASGHLKKLTGVGKKLGIGMAAGALVAGVGVLKFGKDSISAASDAQQSFGATQAVFGKFAKQVIKDSRGAADAYGLSANEFRESSNLIGSLLKNQGVAQDKLGDKTKRLVQLGADLSATYGGKAKDAVEALGSAFKGEFDPLEQYGVSLKQSTINTEAYRIANVKTQGEFSKLTVAQQRAATQQATMAILMRQTKDAQGQFAKQTGTLAEKQQILAAKFENVKAKIGRALLPAVSGFVGFLSDKAMPALDTAAGKVREFFKTKGNAALKRAVEGIKTAAEGIGTAFDSAKQSASKVKDALGNLDLNNLDGNKIGKALGDAVLSGLQRLGQLAGKIGDTIGKMFDKVDWVGLGIMIGKQAPALVVGLISGIAAFDPIALFKQVAAHWQTVLVAALTIAFMPAKFAGVLEKILVKIPFVGKFLAVALRWVNDLGGKLKSFGADLLRTFWRGFTSTPIPGVSFVTKVIRAIAGLPGALSSFWRSIQTRMGVWALDAFEAAGRGARTGIGKLVRLAGTIGGKILNAVGSLARTLYNAGASVIQGLIDGISSKFNAVKSKLGELTGKLTDWKGPPKRDATLLTPAGEAIMQSLINGFKKKWTPVKDFLQKVTDKVKETGDKLAGLVSQRNDFANSFRGFSSSIFGRDPGQDAEGNAIPESVAGIKAFAAKQRQDADTLARNVQRLVGLGLSKSLLTQLQSQGSSGVAQINALAGASKSDIAFLNQQDKATTAANQRAGMAAANAIYGADIKKAQQDNAAMIKALHDMRDELRHLSNGKLHAEIHGDQLVLVIRRDLKKKGKRDPFS